MSNQTSQSEMKHTPEPWTARTGEVRPMVVIPSGGGWELEYCAAGVIVGPPQRQYVAIPAIFDNDANAARIVACVNALAGIPDPSAHTEAVKRIAEAAKNAVPMMEMAWKHNGVGGMFECMDALRSALTAYQQSGGGANA